MQRVVHEHLATALAPDGARPDLVSMAAAVLQFTTGQASSTGRLTWPDTPEMVSAFQSSSGFLGPVAARLPDGSHCTTYWRGPELHRDPGAGPARRRVWSDLEADEYWVEGKPHREEREGPAVISRVNSTGIVLLEVYCRNGKWHRDHAPAALGRHHTGARSMVGWYRDGHLDRDPEHGAALTTWDSQGRLTRADYWVAGVHIDSLVADDAGGDP
jgi:hypothetical protein